MRKLLLVGIMFFCVSFVRAQKDEVEETILKSKEETYNNIDYLNKHYGHIKPGDIIEIKPDNTIQETEEPQMEETTETPSTPADESLERSSSSSNVTPSGSSSSSSARKS